MVTCDDARRLMGFAVDLALIPPQTAIYFLTSLSARTTSRADDANE